MLRISTLALAGLLVLPSAVSAVTVWDEDINGDLSGDRMNPTSIVFTPGSNEVISTTVAGDLDYYTFTIPVGFVLQSTILTSFVSFDILGFTAIQSGSIFTEPPVGTMASNLLGYVHTSAAHLNTDVLPVIGTGLNAIGFIPPLPAGDYTIWSQQTGGQEILYGLDFIVVAPEPGSLWLLGMLLVGVAAAKRS